MKIFTSRRSRLLAAGSITSAAIAVSLMPFNMGGCSAGGLNVTNLVEGTKTLAQSAALSEKNEPAIGESVALQATNRYPIYPDKELTRYVTLVGRTVGSASTQPGLNYYFAILDTPEVNAFSAPHGFVFVTRGAIARMKDESELAGVLAHEIGHVCKHHGLNAVRSANTAKGMGQLASSAGNVAQFSSAIDGGSEVILNTGFSQPQENEADAEGVKFVTAAGYDPNGYLHFLQRMAAEQGRHSKVFSTHPGLGDRVKRVQDQINKMNNPGGETLADRFAANVTLK